MKIHYKDLANSTIAMDIVERENLITNLNGGYIDITDLLLCASKVKIDIRGLGYSIDNAFYNIKEYIEEITMSPIPIDVYPILPFNIPKIPTEKFNRYGSYLRDYFVMSLEELYPESSFNNSLVKIIDGDIYYFKNIDFILAEDPFYPKEVFYYTIQTLGRMLHERKVKKYTLFVRRPLDSTWDFVSKANLPKNFKVIAEDHMGLLIEYYDNSGEHTVPKKHFICNECKTIFYVSQFEQKYYKEKNLKLPKRCPICRKKRRVNQW